MDYEKERKKREDEYFARKEFERRKKMLDEEHGKMKDEEKKKLKELHWMRCPKCGMEMLEINLEGIKVDKCTECSGYFFDKGELEQVIEKKTGFFNNLAKLFTN